MSLFNHPARFYIFFLAILSTALSACTYEEVTPVDYTGNTSGVCFESEILPVFQTNCTQSGCHNAVEKKHGFDLSGYEGIMEGIYPGSPERSKAFQYMIKTGGNVMPPPPYSRLDQATLNKIAQWIEEGARNTTQCADTTTGGNTNPTCDLSAVTYSGTVAPLMQLYCNGCHSGTAAAHNIRTDTYTNVKALAAKPSFMGSMQHLPGYSPMPQNASRLSTCQLDQIAKWIELGAKQD